SSCPTVLEAGNALPFTPAFWRALRRESVSRRLEELARWHLLRSSLLAATRILAPTRAMRQDVVASVPTLSQRVDVPLWGGAHQFPQRRWVDPPGAVVLGVSRPGINKEFAVLVQALPELLRHRPATTLELTGTVQESRWAQHSWALARQIGVADRVRFV